MRWIAVSVLLVAGCSSAGDTVETAPEREAITTTSALPVETAAVPTSAPVELLPPPSIDALLTTEPKPEDVVVATDPNFGIIYVLGPAELDGSAVLETSIVQSGSGFLLVTLTDEGARAFDALAERHLGKQLAVLVDGLVLMAPTIQQADFGGQMQIVAGGGDLEAVRSVVLASIDRPDRFLVRPVAFAQPAQTVDAEELADLVVTLAG